MSLDPSSEPCLPRSAKAITFVLTRDRAVTLPFYTQILGLTLVSEGEYSAILDAHGVVLHLTTVEGHQPSPHPVLGWAVPDLVATMRALAAVGVKGQIYPGFGQDDLGIWTSPDQTSKVSWFTDPEGNLLSLTEG